MRRSNALGFALAAGVGGAAGLALVHAVEGFVSPPHALAGWVAACANAAAARWINARAMRRSRPESPSPLWGTAANGLRWLAMLGILAGYAFVLPAGFAAFGLTAAVTSLGLVGAEVAHLHRRG